MYLNLMELIKNAKPGTTLRSKGGDRHRYQRFVFVKARKNTVNVYAGWTWKQIKDLVETYETEHVVCTLKPDKVIFNLRRDTRDNAASGPNYLIYNLSSFLALNLLHDCWTRWSHSDTLIHTADFEFIPFARMEFSWNGKLLSSIPKSAQLRYNKWDRSRKDRINTQSRARYAQQKAEREFRKYEKDGKLDEYPVENVFTIRNAQLRSHAINAIGIEKVLAPYPSKVIDKDTIDGRPYELIDIEMPAISIYRWGQINASSPQWCLYLKMTNPSTGEYHLEGVPRKSNQLGDHIPEDTVKGALAWRDGEQPERNWNMNTSETTYSDWKYIQPTVIT